MYGMVNRAARAMILAHHGEPCWQQIRHRIGTEFDDFEGMRQYPDSLTYDIVQAASAELETPVPEILERFGAYWITFARAQGYEPMLTGTATNLFDFLESLDDLHSRLALSFSDYTPPSFYCTERSASSVRLHYLSERAGLTHFVKGLLFGLSELFHTPVNVTLEQSKSQGAEHDVFWLELKGE